MARIALYNLPAYGHINPTLGLVRELVRRGDEVLYFSTPPFREHLERAGATFVDYGIDFWPRGSEPAEGLKVLENMVSFALALSERLVAQARTLRLDAVIHDAYTVWGKKVAEVLGVPGIATFPNYAVDLRFYFRSSLIDVEGVRRVARGLPALARLVYKSAKLHRRLRLRRLDLLDVMFNPEPLNLVFTSREMQARVEDFDERYVFVGANVERTPGETDFPLGDLEGRTVVYISMGTVYNQRPDYYREILEEFASARFTVVLSVGRDVDIDALGEVPRGIIVRPSVPQLDVLQRSSAFVTQAGSTSVNEALYFGVPMICMPRAADQHWTARRIRQTGAGLDLGTRPVDAAFLRRNVERILSDPGYARRAAALGESMRRAGGPTAAADHVHRFLARAGVALRG